MGTIAEAIQGIREKIHGAELRSGRKAGSVSLMAVSKFHTVQEILEAADCGITLFGENRAQEAAEKFPDVFAERDGIELHMIGSLQRNKVKQIVPLVTCVQSVDRLELISEIQKHAAALNRRVKILFEFHTGEESKSGFQDEDSLLKAVDFCASCPAVVPSGFMTMAPFTSDIRQVRAAFRLLTETARRVRDRFPELPLTELSMGMSGDFETAIEEGSTLVRIGTAIFGERR